MTTILMILLALAVVCLCYQSWVIHDLRRERDKYVSRSGLYQRRWEESSERVKQLLSMRAEIR